jgi:hypothetical protein
MLIKGKTEKLFVSQLNLWKEYARNQRLHKKTKPENHRHWRTRGVCNKFNKIITENFSNLEKTMPIQVKEVSRTPMRLDQNRTIPQHIIIKTTSTENKEYWRL